MDYLAAATLFGPDSTTSDHLIGTAIIVVALFVLLSVGWLILKLLRISQRATVQVSEDAVAALGPELTETANQVLAEFTFTTYTGFGLWTVQSQHVYRLPPDLALHTLRRLLRHNLTRGVLGPGLVFIPFLSLAEYWQQKRRVARQREGFAPVFPNSSGQRTDS